MASRLLTDLDPRMRALAERFLDKCAAANLLVFIDQTYRSAAEQNILYAQGRTTPGAVVTHARGGLSPHNCVADDGVTPAARAFDIAIHDKKAGLLDWNVKADVWQGAITIGRNLGLICGFDWPEPKKDGPHFELPNWQSL